MAERGDSLRIAAVIPLYNGARFIQEALESVLAQTQAPSEVIVVDDGSTDDGAGAAIVRHMAERAPITLLTKANGGQSSARNLGIARCGASLIALLDQDDVWYPEHLERLSEPFRRNVPHLGWVYSDLDRIDASGKIVTRSMLGGKKVEHPKRTLTCCLGQDMFVLPSASLISRAAFDAVGGFDERLCGYEDDDLFLRLFRAGYHNVYIDEALSQWRITGNTASYSPAMGRSRLIYASKLIAEYPEHVHSVIVPRFMRSISGDAQRHIKARNNAAMRKAIEDAKCFAAYLPVRRRIRLRLADTLFRHWRIGRVLRARRFIRA